MRLHYWVSISILSLAASVLAFAVEADGPSGVPGASRGISSEPRSPVNHNLASPLPESTSRPILRLSPGGVTEPPRGVPYPPVQSPMGRPPAAPGSMPER